jgi:hypothetical protein
VSKAGLELEILLLSAGILGVGQHTCLESFFIAPILLTILFSFYSLFSLCVTLGNFYLIIFQFINSFLSCAKTPAVRIKGILHP